MLHRSCNVCGIIRRLNDIATMQNNDIYAEVNTAKTTQTQSGNGKKYVNINPSSTTE